MKHGKTFKHIAIFLFICCLISQNQVFSQEINLLFNRIGIKDGLSNNNIETIVKDKYGFVWISTWDGVNRYDGYKFTIFKHDTDNPKSLSESRVRGMFLDKDSSLWVHTFDDVLNKFDYHTEEFTQYDKSTFGQKFLDSVDYIHTEERTYAYGNIRLTSYNGYMLERRPSGYAQGLAPDPANPHSVSDGMLIKYTLDDQNLLWISSRVGVNMLNMSPQEFYLYRKKNVNDNILTQNNIRAIIESSNGELWVGMANAGVTIIDRKTNMSRHLQMPILSGNTVRGLYEDSRGNIWIGEREGLDCYNMNTGEITSFTSKIPDIPQAKMVYTALEDSKGNLWFGTFGGLLRLDKTTETFVPYNAQNKMLGGDLVRDIHEDSEHNLWVCTENAGLTKLTYYTDKETHKDTVRAKFYTFDAKKKNTINASRISNMTEDVYGNLWVATANGIAKYDKANDCFIRYGKAKGIVDALVGGVIADLQGNIWFCCNTDLYRMNVKTETVRRFDESAGLQGGEFNGDAVFRSKSGEIFMGGVDGFNAFFPEKIVDKTLVPKVVFTDLFVNNKVVEVNKTSNKRSILTNPVYLTKEITLTHHDYIFSLEFAALDYSNPKAIIYMYKLEGFDNEWITTTADNRRVTYTNLDAGTYVLRVRATNSDGIWGENETSLIINVLPPWWATWWFQFFVVATIVASAVTFYKARVNMLRRQQVVLETKVKERTSELNESNCLLEEKQEEVLQQNQAILAQNHEISAQKELLEEQNTQISKGYENLKIISSLGRKITSSLKTEDINQMVFDYVNSLIAVDIFGIGVYIEQKQQIDFVQFIENNKPLPQFSSPLTDPSSLAAWCVLNKKEVYIKNFEQEYSKYIQEISVRSAVVPKSIICIPLLIETHVIGVLSIQNYNENAYTENDLMNIYSVASFLAIAVNNSQSYNKLNFQNEQIKGSINYAQTIQQAILPPKDMLDKLFDNYMIYKPKDVVSGDFYWATDLRTDGNSSYGFVAVVDCTGHGVPGAFMSLIGSRLLNEIVIERGIHEPIEVLNTLDTLFAKALRQDITKNDDGMDLALIKYYKNEPQNQDKTKIVFAGAKVPLYHYKQGEDQIEIVSASRKSICGINSQEFEFTQQELWVAHNDLLFLSTDGIIDQQNSQRRKLGSKAFTKALHTIANLPFETQQRAFEAILEKHQGSELQRDDMSFMAIRLHA